MVQPMTKQHVLLLYTPAGGGHRAAASAIEESLGALAPEVTVDTRNILDFAPSWFRYDRMWSLWQVHGASAWDWFFDLTDNKRATAVDKIRFPLHRALFRALDEYLLATQPTHIIATHYLPAIAVARLRRSGKLRARTLTVVTDHITHQAWATPGIDNYCVADHAVARSMQRRDPGATVHVTGIPVSRDVCAPVRAVDSQIDKPRVLALLSGVPEKDAETALASLAPLAVQGNVHLHILCGSSERVLGAARRLFAGTDAVIAERAPSLLPLFDQSDVIVTKAGGLSVSECMSRGRAMVLPFAAPGQERGNLFYALDAGAAVRPLEVADTGRVIAELAAEPGKLRRMGFRARLASRPQAADDIVRVLFAEAQAATAQETTEVKRAA